jgi:hypothetical protein
MRNKKRKLFSDKQLPFVGAAVALVVIAGGIMIWHQAIKNNKPTASKSSASEITNNHWPHSTVPFSLTLMSSLTPVWKTSFVGASSDWTQAGVIKFRQVSGPLRETCDFLPEMINLCSYTDPNTIFLAYGQYISYNRHIVAANAGFNEAYFNNPKSPFGTVVWRNRELCGFIGWLLGEEWTGGEPGNPKSCMEGGSTFEGVVKQQHPTTDDLGLLKLIYDHRDDNSSSAVSSGLPLSSSAKDVSAWGKKVQVTGNGAMELYQKDLGNGYVVTTFAHRKQ